MNELEVLTLLAKSILEKAKQRYASAIAINRGDFRFTTEKEAEELWERAEDEDRVRVVIEVINHALRGARP